MHDTWDLFIDENGTELFRRKSLAFAEDDAHDAGYIPDDMKVSLGIPSTHGCYVCFQRSRVFISVSGSLGCDWVFQRLPEDKAFMVLQIMAAQE